MQAVSAAELSYQWYEYVNIYGYVPIEGANEDIYVIEEAGTRSFNPARDYYYPIPTYEIATSEGSVVQNPGW